MTQEMRKEDGGLIQKALCDQIFPNPQAAKLEVVSAGSQPAVCRTLPAVMRAAAISSGKALPMGVHVYAVSVRSIPVSRPILPCGSEKRMCVCM